MDSNRRAPVPAFRARDLKSSCNLHMKCARRNYDDYMKSSRTHRNISDRQKSVRTDPSLNQRKLRALINRGDGATEQAIMAAPLHAFLLREGSDSNLLSIALHAPVSAQKRAAYAHRIMDRDPKLCLPTEGHSYVSYQRFDSVRGSSYIDDALSLGDENLLIRFAASGAPVSLDQLKQAHRLKMDRFVEYLLTDHCTQSDVKFLYCGAVALGSREKDWILNGLEKRFNPSEQRELVENIIADSDIRDFLDDFTNRVLVPAQMLVEHPSPTVETLAQSARTDAYQLRLHLVQTLLERAVAEGRKPTDVLRTLSQLSYSWHHPQMTFHRPNYTAPEGVSIPETIERAWHPLIAKPFKTSNGFEIHNLTSDAQLRRESRALKHCVANYGANCTVDSDARSHIFSIRTPTGHSQSTFEVRLASKPREGARFVRVGNQYLSVMQHEAEKVEMVRAHVSTGPLHEALEEFLTALETGALPLLPGPYGETEASKAASHLSDAVKTCGYFPSWQNVDLTLQEFKKDIRRGASAIDADGWLLHGEHAPHFIDGDVEAEGKSLSMRDMNAREWLRATGMLGVMHGLAGKPYPPAPLTASLPPPETPEQYGRRMTREAHAFNSGSLDAGQVRQLSPRDRIIYQGRLRELRGPSPYFDRI